LWHMTIIPALWRLRQEDHELLASLDHSKLLSKKEKNLWRMLLTTETNLFRFVLTSLLSLRKQQQSHSPEKKLKHLFF
jgi:hypothetical protein